MTDPSNQSKKRLAKLWAAFRTGHKVNRWLGVVLNVAALAGFAGSVGGLIWGSTWTQTVLAIALAVVALGFAVLAVTLQATLEQVRIEAAGDEAIRKAHEPLASAASALSFATKSLHENRALEVFETQGHEFASELAKAYTVITSTPCTVTVKHTYPQPDGDDVAVKTIFTSTPSHMVERRDDIDLVKENTDFSELLGKGDHFWISDDVTNMPGYINSHYTREQLASGEPPYRSVLVWPIRASSVSHGATDVHLLGFLCVDSPEVGTFQEGRDVSPGEIFSHTLYSSMTLYKRAKEISATNEDGK